MIQWQTRRKTEDTKYASRKALYTKCKRFKVIEIEILYGRGRDREGKLLGYPITCEARRLTDSGDWVLISEHQKVSAAKRAVVHYEKKGKAKERQTKEVKTKKKQQAKRKQRKAKHNGSDDV
jgi:hypothetical protein